MKVALEKVFAVPSHVDAAWACLRDIEAVAGCVPGATITERVDDTHYKGTITVRLGPATMSFKGTLEVIGLDHAAKTLHLSGKGSDTTGTSGASMDLIAGVREAGDASELTGKSEVSMTGKAAAFGGRMMNTVADQILKQFAANFAALSQRAEVASKAQSDSGALATAATTVTPTPVTTATAESDASAEPQAAGATGSPQSSIPATMTATSEPGIAVPRTAPAELNGFSLLWAIVRDWFRGLFSRNATRP